MDNQTVERYLLRTVSERTQDHGLALQEVQRTGVAPAAHLRCLPLAATWNGWSSRASGKLRALTSIVVAPPAMAREGFGRNNPYVVGVVELDEGVKAVARIIGVDAKNPETIRVGTPLQAEFLPKGEGPDQQTALVFKT